MKEILRNVYTTIISSFRDKGKLIYDLATPLQKELLSFENSGYLKEIGWITSKISQEPFDEFSNPVPWITYSAIEFLKTRLKPGLGLNVLEFGAGNSTLYFAALNYNVTSIEHDRDWYLKVQKKLQPYRNVQLEYIELEYGGEYSKVGSNQLFDLVMVDGRDRVNCAVNSYSVLKDDGVLVLDDSERDQYSAVLDFYLEKSFKRIDFWGIAPGVFYNKCTTVLYRENNILSI